MKTEAKKQFESFLKTPIDKRFPKRIILELTNSCNLRCIMCPRRFVLAKEGYMSKTLFKKAIDEISRYPQTGIIPFFRGEPLLHPDFKELIAYAKHKGITPIHLATNATLLNEDTGRTLIELGLDFISFSLDSADEAQYKKVRLGANHRIVSENIARFIAMRKAAKSKLPVIQVSMVETAKTKSQARKFVNTWIDKVDRVRIYKEHSQKGNFGSVSKSKGISLSRRKPCLKMISEMAVYFNGEVALCNHDWDRRISLGNINKETLHSVWNAPEYSRLRNLHMEGKVAKRSTCGRCGHWIAAYMPQGLLGRIYSRDSRLNRNTKED